MILAGVRLAHLLKQPAYVDVALLRARRLRGTEPITVDLVDGSAGLLLALTDLACTSGERWVRQWSVALAQRILDQSAPEFGAGTRLAWAVPSSLPGGVPHPYLGLLHGAAGIGLALLHAGLQLNLPELVDAAARVGNLLVENGRSTTSDGGWRWPLALEEADDALAAQCHGAGGIGQFLVRLWLVTHEPSFLVAARGAAATVSARDPAHASLCHGLAGDGMLMLDLYQATGDDDYLRHASALSDRLSAYRDLARPGIWRRSVVGGTGAEYMTGAAGIAAFLLRLTAPDQGDDLVLPPVWPPSARRSRRKQASSHGGVPAARQ